MAIHGISFPSRVDSVGGSKRNKEDGVDYGTLCEKKSGGVFLLSHGRRSRRFFTDFSRRYVSPREEALLKDGYTIRPQAGFDGAYRLRRRSSLEEYLRRRRETYRGEYWHLQRRYFGLRHYLVTASGEVFARVSLVRAWNFSIVGAILFGMLSMSLLYRSLGPGARAEENDAVSAAALIEETTVVLGESIESESAPLPVEADLPIAKGEEQQEFENRVREMVAGYPIEKMLPEILGRDRIVAAYLVAIAKKESNWGKRVPVLDGEDCLNYWGYRGVRKDMGTGGHTCFDSAADAVKTVADRLEWYIKQKKRDTPAELIVWKCGSSCDGHSKESVRKWISDVDLYASKLLK